MKRALIVLLLTTTAQADPIMGVLPAGTPVKGLPLGTQVELLREQERNQGVVYRFKSDPNFGRYVESLRKPEVRWPDPRRMCMQFGCDHPL